MRIRLLVGTFTILGFAMLWFANELWSQVQQITGSTFEMPSGRLLLWLLNLVVVGISFGLAVESAGSGRRRIRIPVLMAWSVVPLFVLFYFWTQVAIGWTLGVARFLNQFVFSEITLTASEVALGFFIAGMIGQPLLSGDPEVSADSDAPEPTSPPPSE